jgi:hypothetical protein
VAVTAEQFANDLLRAAQLPLTPQNVQFIAHWLPLENTQALHNPMATELQLPGSTFFNYTGPNQGVQNYPTYEQGLVATAKTLHNGYYPTIVAGLRSGNPWALHDQGAMRNELKIWSGAYDMIPNRGNLNYVSPGLANATSTGPKPEHLVRTPTGVVNLVGGK